MKNNFKETNEFFDAVAQKVLELNCEGEGKLFVSIPLYIMLEEYTHSKLLNDGKAHWEKIKVAGLTVSASTGLEKNEYHISYKPNKIK